MIYAPRDEFNQMHTGLFKNILIEDSSHDLFGLMQINKNASLNKTIDELFEKGRDTIQYSALEDIQKKVRCMLLCKFMPDTGGKGKLNKDHL